MPADTNQQERYMVERVKDQLEYYEAAANKAKRAHMLTQTSIIVLDILVPVIANLDQVLFGSEATKTVVITIVSLTLAIVAGIANFRKYGDLWLAYRTTEETIKKEMYLFKSGAGPYRNGESPFKVFVERIENTISVEHEKFRSLIESAPRPTTETK